jgi:hypothetical protein
MIAEQIQNTEIFKIKNFLDADSCDQLVNWFSSSERNNNTDDFFKNRTLAYSNIQDSRIKKFIGGVKYDLTYVVRSCFQEAVFPNYTDLVFWPSNSEMESHADNSFPDRTDNGYGYRNITALIYLNDNFRGGETFFSNKNITVSPERGLLIMYPSNLEYSHGVRKVLGDRYTLAAWFTKDLNYIEL